MSNEQTIHEHSPLPERVLMLAVPKIEAAARNDGDIHHGLLWHSTFAAVKDVVPGAVTVHTGCCIMHARGPSRYYGSEAAAAAAVLTAAINACGPDVSRSAITAVANGRFAAQQVLFAAGNEPEVQSPSLGVRIVEPQHTSSFLASLPVSRAAHKELADVLISLGVHTLGAFAELPQSAVLQRFGLPAMAPHHRARGLGELRTPEVPIEPAVSNLTALYEFDSPLTNTDQLAFSCVTRAESFFAKIREQGLVCTELHIELHDDAANHYERTWSHQTTFTAIDIVNRIRWQASSLPAFSQLKHTSNCAGIIAVRITAARTANAAEHEPGLWNNAPDKRVHHQLTRVQSLIGYEGVATGALTGGRLSLDRQKIVPWATDNHENQYSSERPSVSRTRSRDGPWPGHLPGALPNFVFSNPPRVVLHDEQDESLSIDSEEMLSAIPNSFAAEGSARHTVIAWSALWPLRERWWSESEGEDKGKDGTIFRLQVLLENNEAWLLQYKPQSGWFAEGRYK